MGGMALKEKAILAMLGVVVLYAAAAAVWFLHMGGKTGEWAKAAKAYHRERDRYSAECRLIARKAELSDSYEEAKSLMPTFESGKTTDTTWLQKMDEFAAKHYIQISNRQGGKEVEAGEVLELTIDVKNWEGALESLVKFLYELDTTSEGMFDVRSISFRPSNKKGFLKGSFALTCAYMRED